MPAQAPGAARRPSVSGWLVGPLFLGIYLSTHGYHSWDGDQAYRLPLLLHWQSPRLFANDPFVRAFDDFNPHRGALIVLDVFARPLGTSAGLLALFVLTFALTCQAVARLARAVWPEWEASDFQGAVGWVAVGLFLAAKAGNIGTNHLFEPMVLDRLIAFALGWQALAVSIIGPERSGWRAAGLLGLAAWVHPSAGLQLAMAVVAGRFAWCAFGRWTNDGGASAWRAGALIGLALVPGLALNLARGQSLAAGMPADQFRLLSVELQGPQHMLPHLWRMPQWLAWSSYLVLAALALVDRPSRRNDRARALDEMAPGEPAGARDRPIARRRLSIALAALLAGLFAAWVGVEIVGDVRLTIFQPFRMATLARGMALVLIAGRLVMLWKSERSLGRARAVVLATAFHGDWLLVVATIAEVIVSIAEAALRPFQNAHGESDGPILPGGMGGPPAMHRKSRRWARDLPAIFYLGTIARGASFLGHHDTESGHVPLLIALGLGLVLVLWGRLRPSRARADTRPILNGRRWAFALAAAWALPAAALVAGILVEHGTGTNNRAARVLIDRCRFVEAPTSDLERLAVWCRAHVPISARFVGPPGPKTFRLWSRRNLAFNRSASPYHAAGLADWFARFQDHVHWDGPPAEFVRAYVADRHGFEARYQKQSDAERAALAVRQQAGYVIAAAPRNETSRPRRDPEPAAVASLELLHVEGRYAVYRVVEGEGEFARRDRQSGAEDQRQR